jgi:hypothetical protein
VTLADGDLHDLRCRTCGRLIGYSSYATNRTVWCNEFCANTPVGRNWNNQGRSNNRSRDELIVAMFLEGRTAVQIGDELELTRQNIQQILDKRGINPFGRVMAPRHEVAS